MCGRNHCSCAECQAYEQQVARQRAPYDRFLRDVRRLQRLERQRSHGAYLRRHGRNA